MVQVPTDNREIPLILPTPVKVDILCRYLDGFDQEQYIYLKEGFSKGFSLGTVGVIPPSLSRNHISVSQSVDILNFVENKLNKEINLGRIKGPYQSPPLPNFKCFPLGVVPKKEPNTFRLIHDLSFGGENKSVNSFIPFENSTVSLETFDHVVSLVLQCGKNSLIAKADLEEAFRTIPISPLDYHKLGFSFKNQFYFDRVLPMGASSSVRIYESLSKALQWILQNKLGVSHVSHIIDDFIFIGPENSDQCEQALTKFIAMCEKINIPIKHSKTIMPTSCTSVHGIELDTVAMEARLPADKVENLSCLLAKYKLRKKIKLGELQSILGHLNFACKVVKPGRCFLRRLYDLTCGKIRKHHFIKLNAEARADLATWSTFLKDYNGRTILTDDRFISSNSLQLYTDSAQSRGFACIFQQFWAYGAFSDKVKKFHINILELYPIALAVFLFGHHWRNRNVLFISDNLSIVYCINKQTSKDKIIMRLLRIIVLESLRHNFCFAAKHITSKQNSICDKLSRFQIAEAKAEAKYLQKLPVQIPAHLIPDTLLL